jgi:hypothetical protein
MHGVTEEEQIGAIERFGYTTPEAAFLRLVALHGGYFLRRQILKFEDSDFIEKLTDRKHASLEIHRDDRQLYRLHFKPIYAAIGQAKIRNRRDQQPATIRVRLMALDFVLAHPECEFLTTEEEKLAYLVHTQRINPDVVPARSFCIKGRHLIRRFADEFPMFLSEDQPYCVSFCYIDDRAFSLAAFRSYLVRYRPLFQALDAGVSLYFVTQQQSRFEAARKMFRRFSDRMAEAEPVVNVSRLLVHFPHRLLSERRDTRDLNTAQIHRLQQDLHTFSGPEYERLFALWKQGGAAAIRSEVAADYERKTSLDVRLSAHILEHDYEVSDGAQASSYQPTNH